MTDVPHLSPVAVENLVLQLLLKTLQLEITSSSGNDSEFERLYPTTAPEAAAKQVAASERELKHSSEFLAWNCLSHLGK